jgi:hypothetical protein
VKVTAPYSVKKWTENTIQVLSLKTKTTKASVEYGFEGDLNGTGAVEYLMYYSSFDEKDPHASTATYVGMITFTGTINGKSGTFVMEDHGAFEGGAAISQLKIIDGSGTGGLAKIKGTGSYHADKKGFQLTLDCEF